MADTGLERVRELEARCAELEQALAEARADEALMRSIIDTVPDFVVKATPDGVIQYINRVGVGLNLGRVVGATMYSFVPKEDHAMVKDAIRRVIESGEPTTYEASAFRADGRRARYYARVAPISHDGVVDSVVVIATDITAITEAQEALSESHEKLALAVGSSGVGLWSWHADSGKMDWDLASRRIFGREQAPPDLEAYLECIHPEDRARVEQVVLRAGRTRVYDDIEHRVVQSDGSVRWVMCRGRVLGDLEHGNLRVLGGILDVTERRELQEQLLQAQKMEAVGQLAAGIAHNFNNMLTVMLSSMELAEKKSDEEVRHFLLEGEEAALRASKIVRQLMLFSGKRRPAEPRIEDLSLIVSRMVEMCRTTFAREIEIELSCRAGPLAVRCDASQLEQALLNVLINARDALESIDERPRKIVVGVDEVRGTSGSKSWCVTISDNGVGMSEEVKRRAFEPFFSTKKPGRGTGLGLATTYAIVKEHAGSMEWETKLGAGTTLRVYLPEAPYAPAVEEKKAVVVPSSGHGECILMVDDERLVRDVVSQVLVDAGYAVETASDGMEALEMLRQAPARYALVLLDQSMPRLSGKSALQELRAIAPELRVVCFSGHVAELEGADAVLEKPAPAERLIETVRQVLSTRTG